MRVPQLSKDTLLDAQVTRSALKLRHAREALDQVKFTLAALDDHPRRDAYAEAVETLRHAFDVLDDAVDEPGMDPERALTLARFLRDEAWRLLGEVQRRP